MIPKTMSTQHPDNARMPEWSNNRSVIKNDDEIEEAFISFKNLGIKEVMWDAEGKDVDTHVIRKLFAKDNNFFNDNVLGKNLFLTYRVPNPLIEGAERKILNETLNSIPLNYDVANRIYNKNIAPIFEVILPFTTDYRSMLNIVKYYEKAIVRDENINLYDDVYLRDVTGEVLPKKINLIPLIEDKDSIYNIHDIIETYCKYMKPDHMRIFIARSDPAMNYGMLPATLLAKYASFKIKKLEEDLNIKMYPMLGAGSSPFRGNLGPLNIENALNEYNSYYTYTIQSAFRYDYDNNAVKRAVDCINKHEPSDYVELDGYEEDSIKNIINKYSIRFQKIIESLASAINDITVYLPKRRARKLHIGLFGYSRQTGTAKLPRAISFVAALYSMGIPPEILGMASLNDMSEQEISLIGRLYKNMDYDIKNSTKYFNYDSLRLLKDIWHIDVDIINMIRDDMKYVENNIGVPTDNSYNTDKHILFSTLLLLAFKDKKFDDVKNYIYEMGLIRKFMG